MPSLEIRRPMMRCQSCNAWWSGPPHYAAAGDARNGLAVDPEEVPAHCPCGGELAFVDMDTHRAKLPYVPFDPSKAGSAPKPTS